VALTAWDVPLAPFVTAAGWTTALVARVVRGRESIVTLELVPVACAAVLVQLLLDLHTPWLGDIAIAGAHGAAALIWLAWRRWQR
jgi:hypothetical protein